MSACSKVVRRWQPALAVLTAAFVLLIAIVNGPVIFADEDSTDNVKLMVGRSTVLDVGKPIARVSLTSPDIADALVTSASQLLINGKMPGTISMFVWDRAGGIKRYEVVVQRDLAQLNDQVKTLFPGESITAASNGKSIVLSGSVSRKDIGDRAVEVAAGYVDKKEEVVNLLQVSGTSSNQVLLRVRFAEVSRSVLMELGANLFTGANGYKNYVGRTTTQQFPAPVFDNAGNNNTLVFTDYLNFFLFDLKNQLGLNIKALQTKGLFQTLAEPNLVAESGKEASFLAGGEFPVPVAQPSGGSTAITIVYKEFGVRLTFTPVVNGDRIHLKVRPEVSTLDFANGVTLSGFRVPALSTRRAETELELQNGQMFAMAGLLDNSVTNTMQKIPGIGDIPILGELFKSRSAQKDKTELVVMITPEILPKNSPGVTSELPRTPEQYLPALPDKKTHPVPPAAFEPKPSDADMKAAGSIKTPAKKVEPVKRNDDAAAAAATVSGLTPSSRPVTNADNAVTYTTPAPAASASRPPTKQELAQKKADDERMATLEKRAAKERAEQAKKDKVEQERQAKLAKEQAERDREEAKKKAEVDAKQAKAIAEAAAKLKAAQDAYQAELAKKQQQQPKDR
jgi:pilus assembly protein CpaC